jgi:hypothetical protein
VETSFSIRHGARPRPGSGGWGHPNSWGYPSFYGAERLVVQLSAGTHRVEIRREGYDPFATAVEIRRGETTVLNVSLAKL